MSNLEIPIKTHVEYEFRDSLNGKKELLILLHGFKLSGSWMFQNIAEKLNWQGAILSPNAPFPIPLKKNKGWTLGYAWYLFDPETSTYFTKLSSAVDYLMAILKELDLSDYETRIVGFSQGGYLAPYLARELNGAAQIVGMNSRFRSEDLVEKYSFRFDAIHGIGDESVDPIRSEKCHSEIIERGNTGDFHKVESKNHAINDRMVEKLNSII